MVSPLMRWLMSVGSAAEKRSEETENPVDAVHWISFDGNFDGWSVDRPWTLQAEP